jgi:hypothetical protein
MATENSDERVKPATRFTVLLEHAQKFCASVGLPDGLIMEILKTESDWAFILKVDALLETASKDILKHGLKFELLQRQAQDDVMGEFVDSLPMNGRVSVVKLLEGSPFPTDDVRFIEALRSVRNSYAHNIKYLNLTLIDLIKTRKDKSQLLRHLGSVKNHEDEAHLMALIEEDHEFLRWVIIDATVRVMTNAYHYTNKCVNDPKFTWK